MSQFGNENMHDVYEADKKTIKVYLAQGHTYKEAFDVFCKVFKTKASKKRLKILREFIEKFEDKNPKH